MNDQRQPVSILLVEDNPGDVRLTVEAMRDCKLTNPLEVVKDGVDALSFLRQQGVYTGKPRPGLILLDLNLPRMDGREVLAAIKSDERLKTIPVVVLTTSRAEQDVLGSYRQHANCFITKPVDFQQFSAVVKAIECFWLSVVTLPHEGAQ
jgi:CheY-like chemotaxis protein